MPAPLDRRRTAGRPAAGGIGEMGQRGAELAGS